jgi:uncharacterized membrane protein
VIPTPSWEEVVVLGTAEIRGYGVQSLQVHRRLHALIDDLLQIAPTSRVGPLSQLRSVLDRGVGRGFDDGDDQRLARVADAGGLGSDDGADT